MFAGYLIECIGPDFARTFLFGQLFSVSGAEVSACVLAVCLCGMFLVGHRWERVAMDILDMSVTTCLSLPNKSAVAVADTFFQLMICHFGMPAVIHSDQGREFENHLMQELCLLLGAHKTHTTPYHPASDGLVKRLNSS